MADHRLQIILAAKDISGTAFTKFKRSLGAITKSVFSLRGVIGTLAGSAGLGYLVKSSLDAADKIGKAADVAGIHTAALQEYQHAAQLSGVSTELLNNSFLAFNKRLGEAKAGTGALTTYLNKNDKALLENIKSAGSTEEALRLVFDRMASLSSASDRAALAAAAFSRSGVKLTVMTKNGAAGLEAMRLEARALGLVIDDDLIRNAETAADKLDTLGRVLKTQVTATIVELAPKISEVSTNILDWVAANKDLISQNIQSVFESIATAIDKVAAAYKGMDAFFSVSKPDSYLQAYKEQLEQTLVTQKKQLEMFERLGSVGSTAYETLSQRIALTKDHLKIVNAELADMSRNQFATGGGFGGESVKRPTPSGSSIPAAAAGAITGRWAPRRDRDQWAPRAGGLVGADDVLDDLAAKHSETYGAMSDDVYDWQKDTKDAYGGIEQGVDAMSYNMSDALARFAIEGKISFKGLANSIIADLIRIQSRAAVMSLFSGVGGLFAGGGSDLGAAGAGNIGGATTYKMASGGYIGEPVYGIGGRSGSSYEFHPNEVVTPAGNMGGVRVAVNVTNNLGQEADVQQSTNWISPDMLVADIVLNRKLTSRGFRQGLRS